MAISRIPDGPRATQTAASTRADRGQVLGGVGLAQRATHRAAIATTGSAMTRSASRKIGHTAASASDSSASRYRVIAPIRTTSRIDHDVARVRQPSR